VNFLTAQRGAGRVRGSGKKEGKVDGAHPHPHTILEETNETMDYRKKEVNAKMKGEPTNLYEKSE